MIHHFKTPAITVSAKEFNSMPFGRQIEHFKQIESFKQSAKRNHFGQKGRSFSAGLKDFLKLYEAKEYYCINRNSENWKDDSTEIWYK